MIRRPPRSTRTDTLFPYTTLFRSEHPEMSAPDFIVHDAKDTVGVIVKEGIAANTTLTGWVMEDDSRCELKCIDAIPPGHKIALEDIADGDRSEERRAGNEGVSKWRSRWCPYHQ